ncbi:hypothetical protein HYS92_00570 [Candidatus Daviesbacteria bacterium]|nr:hypothetical protein [Candidatus Daviesbacteria bacterium]
MLPNQKGLVMIPLILLIILIALVAGGLYFYFQNPQSLTNVKGVNSTKKASMLPKVFQSPTPTPSPWKIYQDEEYGFEITYPRVGVVWHKDGIGPGECGYAVKEEKGSILIDNFFKIKSVFYNGNLEEYLTQQRAINAYEVGSILDSGADEATQLLRLKPDFEIAVGYPPLAYVKAVFKKGDKIFLMQEIIHNPSNEGGCIQPSVVDPTQFPDIATQTWDITQSIKFF